MGVVQGRAAQWRHSTLARDIRPLMCPVGRPEPVPSCRSLASLLAEPELASARELMAARPSDHACYCAVCSTGGRIEFPLPPEITADHLCAAGER